MPRVTQECDFTIHEDDSSFCSSAGGNADSREDHETRESLGGQTDDSYLEEPGADAETHDDGDYLDDKENSVAHSHTDYEEEEGGNSYLEEEPIADAAAHEDDSHLYTEGSMIHHRVSDGWGDEGDSYLDQEELETDSAALEHADQYNDTEGSIAYSRDDSYTEQHDKGSNILPPAEASEGPAGAEIEEPTSERHAATSESHRRSSGRTDALIQAAAKAVVARIEKHRHTPDQHEAGEDEPDFSILSNTTDGDHLTQEAESDADTAGAQDRASPPATLMQDDVGGDSSSHNGADDDVFSDRSPRSSVDSVPSDPERKRMSETLTQGTRSPRISNMSMYDEEEDFIPTCRATPRPPFRSPSYVKAMQMASPPASVYGSPRSSRRHYNGSSLGGSGPPQYSPRGRSTPTRFKAKEAPLVLLHVTLLPLAWPWGDVLEGAEELGEGTKGLRDAWRMLQSQMGDTVFERGVLLPHPQGDFEVLEERVLESLELPLKRRARILECGHYLGPSNEMTAEDSDSEAEDDEDRAAQGTHWCGTCKHEIKYEALGQGRVFRVKVYASNGLMGAGAWSACWKEMERVDVEIEPWVDGDGQGELARLAAEQARREEEEEGLYMEQDVGYGTEYGESATGEENVQEQEDMAVDRRHNILSSPTPSPHRPENQDRSLLSPAQRMLASPIPSAREQNTSVISRGSAHIVPATSNREMQLEGRSSAAGHRHRESRMLESPADLDDRALPGPQRRLLHEPPNAETQLERSHSALSNHSTPHRAQRQGNARMQIEGRASAEVSREHVEDPFPTPDAQRDPPHPDTDRRRRDEERLREIYGHTPPRAHEDSPSLRRHGESPTLSPHRHEDSYVPGTDGHRDSYAPRTDGHGDSYVPGTDRHGDSYIPKPSPPSPSQQAFERREARRKTYQAASLSELLFEAARVFVGDGRNVVIFLLGVLVLGLAVRGGGQGKFPFAGLGGKEAPDLTVSHAEGPGEDHVKAAEEAVGARLAEAPPVQEHVPECPTGSAREALEMTEREVVRIVETVTETVKVMPTESEAEAEVENEAMLPVEVENEAVLEVEFETQAETLPTGSAIPPEVEAEAPVEDSQSVPEIDEPEAEVESEAESAASEAAADTPVDEVETPAEELQSEPTADVVAAQKAVADDDEPSEPPADTPLHEEL